MSVRAGPVKEEAIVLRSIRHGESSRIVTLFGRSRGRFAVIAKGARKGKAGSIGGNIEPPNLIEALVYFKASRSVQIIGQVTVLQRYPRIKEDLALTGYAAVILELVGKTLTDSEPNELTFNAVLNALQRFENDKGNRRVNLWLFQIDLIKAAGFELDPFPCKVCGSKIASIGYRNQFLLESGSVCCSTCFASSENQYQEENVSPSRHIVMLSGESASLLRRISENKQNSLSRLKPSSTAKTELTRVLTQYLRFHLPSGGSMPAMEMLDKLEGPSSA